VVVELVADGTHLDPATVQEIFDLVGPGAIMLVTDAMAAAGMPDGHYTLGPADVEVVDGVARLAGGGSIAGGTAHLLDVVRTTVQRSGVRLQDAVRAAATTPATVLGRAQEIGILAAGARADLLLTDADLRPVQVVRAGLPQH
jgi:N-acetylglucosamine-6-phosphate deacetylase